MTDEQSEDLLHSLIASENQYRPPTDEWVDDDYHILERKWPLFGYLTRLLHWVINPGTITISCIVLIFLKTHLTYIRTRV
jgi:hypothetical protein